MSRRSKSHKLIDPKREAEIYALMASIIHEHHTHLIEAKIQLCWKFGWKRNKDGILTYGKCKKASDFEAELGDADFIIFLNGDLWDKLTDPFKKALLDHELCHAFGLFDAEKNEWKWRVKKHDLEEFNQIVDRHGLWRREVEEFIEIGKDKPKGIHDDSLDDEEDAA